MTDCATRAIFTDEPGPRWLAIRWRRMTNTTEDVYSTFEDPIQQSEAIQILGVTRAVFRGYLDRGVLPAVDHLGPRGAARVRRGDVLRLKATMETEGRIPASRPEAEPSDCRRCVTLQQELARKGQELEQKAQDLARAHRALTGALGL